jgi:hypothetical protein
MLQLGSDVCFLEHIEQVYQNFTFDEHGLKLKDIQHRDCQNWASAQWICALKARNCLRELKAIRDTHWERTLGTDTYFQILADYIDIFLSACLNLRERIVLTGKVSFSFRIWKLWIKHGDQFVGGNTKNLTIVDSFVSN